MTARQMTIAAMSETNRQRCARWHGEGWPAGDSWSLADWSNAMAGEAGELLEAAQAVAMATGKAANIVKKVRRAETGAPGALDPNRAELLEQLGNELADVWLYCDLLAQRAGIDLQAAIVRKFDAVSVREGFPERLGGDQ